MRSRQPQLSTTLSACAAGCAAVWLVGTTLCDAGHIAEFEGQKLAEVRDQAHLHETAKPAGHRHSHHAHDESGESAHSDGSEGHSHTSHHQHDEEDSCCSNLQLIILTPKPIIISQHVINQLGLPHLASISPSSVLPPWTAPLGRQLKSRIWEFTPELCLGPAFRSHAPPLST